MEASDAQIPEISIRHFLGGVDLPCNKEEGVHEFVRTLSLLFPLAGFVFSAVKRKNNQPLSLLTMKWSVVGVITHLCGISLGVLLIYILNRQFS